MGIRRRKNYIQTTITNTTSFLPHYIFSTKEGPSTEMPSAYFGKNSCQRIAPKQANFMEKNNETTRNFIVKRRQRFFQTTSCQIFTILASLIIIMAQPCCSIVNFFSTEDLKYTFGVDHLRKVPSHRQFFPRLIYDNKTLTQTLILKLDDDFEHVLNLKPVTHELVADRLTIVERQNSQGSGDLKISYNFPRNATIKSSKQRNGWSQIAGEAKMPVDECHFHVKSEKIYAAVSNCDGNLKGVIILAEAIYVIHPIPDRHMSRAKRSSLNNGNNENIGLHVIYKRDAIAPQEDFCGIEPTITNEDLSEDEAGVVDDVFVVGQRLVQESDLVVELAIFVDELLWRHFFAKHGSMAWQKLQQYSLTMLSNIQIMYRQPSAVPQLTFRVVRYEVFKTQPSALAPHLHSNGHAQRYLDYFCRYQHSLGVRDWDHALLLTGYDIHRGVGSNSISGIARLDGMCDPWNTCTLAEGLDFTSAFIGTHELGHNVGMRHDEPYCQSRFIMSSSLGPGKVTWSTCSLRDYHTFLQRLDNRRKNCLRTSNLREKLPLTDSYKPGQMYDANMQCALMHGPSYKQIAPRQDHYDGICYMIWCGQDLFGRIITSHPALEGTFCGPNKWCELGRCVPWTGGAAPAPAPVPVPQPSRIDGQWSSWSPFHCDRDCFCAQIAGAVGVTLSRRACTNPAPSNGGEECSGSQLRAVVCQRACNDTQTINQYISTKCAEHKLIKNDPELTGDGSQLTRYPQRACKVFCDVRGSTPKNYRFYGDNLPDGTPCGFDRYCLDGECLDLSCGQTALFPRDLSTSCPSQNERCPLANNQLPQPPPNNGQWMAWSLWSSCSASCGGGFQLRTRVCSINNHCGVGEPTERIVCNTEACLPNGQPPPEPENSDENSWSDWTPWNQCSVSCGRGSQARYRRCQTPQTTIAFSCPGKTMDIRNCDELPCQNTTQLTVGQWASWGAWAECSVSCGPGTQTRYRTCSKEPCDGAGQQRLACNLRECAQWNLWGLWSECSRLCGKGLRSRSRTCQITNGCTGSSIEQGFCNEQVCAPGSDKTNSSDQWTTWSEWSVCSVSCGAGVKRRTRHCQNGNCVGDFRESAICNEGECSKSDAIWGGWGYWSACSVTCGNGIRRRVRKCYGSGNCYGNEYERENCTPSKC